MHCMPCPQRIRCVSPPRQTCVLCGESATTQIYPTSSMRARFHPQEADPSTSTIRPSRNPESRKAPPLLQGQLRPSCLGSSVSLPSINYARSDTIMNRKTMLQHEYEVTCSLQGGLQREYQTPCQSQGLPPPGPGFVSNMVSKAPRSQRSKSSEVKRSQAANVHGVHAEGEPSRSRLACLVHEEQSQAEDTHTTLKHSFGSIVGLLELDIAEARIARRSLCIDKYKGQMQPMQPTSAVSESKLDVASRSASESCLLALRQLASVVSSSLGPVLLNVAETLEPCLFCDVAEQRDEDGRRMTHEQVATYVLRPQLNAEAELACEAEAARRRCGDLLRLEEDRSARLGSEVGALKVQVAKLEEARQAAQLSAERQAVEARAVQQQMQHALDKELEAARIKFETLRSGEVGQLEAQLDKLQTKEEALEERAAELTLALETSISADVHTTMQAQSDGLRADLRASSKGRLSAILGLHRARAKVDRLERELAELRAQQRLG